MVDVRLWLATTVCEPNRNRRQDLCPQTEQNQCLCAVCNLNLLVLVYRLLTAFTRPAVLNENNISIVVYRKIFIPVGNFFFFIVCKNKH